jgi:hypothetical protein
LPEAQPAVLSLRHGGRKRREGNVATRDISSMLVSWLGLIAAIIGGYATFHQYRESVSKQVDDRSTTAINFVMQFQNMQMLPLREKIYDYIFCRNDCAAKTPSSSQVFAFVEFFDAVKYCADKQLCDPVIIREVFAPYATWHWPCLEPTVAAVRRAEASLNAARPFGHGLQGLAAQDVGTGHCGNTTR